MRKELAVTFLTFSAVLIILLLTPADAPYADAVIIAVILAVSIFTLIRQYVRLKRESIIKEKMEDMNRSLKEESEHDELTGLFDRGALRKNYNGYCGQPLGTAMIDVDHFKEFNDTYGHQAGDAILKKFGRILKDNFGDAGDCYRYGGDEFLVIVPKADNKDFEDRHRACHAALKEPDPQMPALHPTMSAGYVISCPLTANDLRKVLKMTDDQLYQAKSQGRDRSCGCTYKKNAEVQEHEDMGRARQEVLVDSLTGLSNRLGFLRQGKKILKFEAGKTHRSLIYLQMTGLEAFREKSGYAAASNFTKTFADILTEQFQGSLLGTFSLDTFVILTVEENPERHIQKLQKEIADS